MFVGKVVYLSRGYRSGRMTLQKKAYSDIVQIRSLVQWTEEKSIH